MDTVLKPASNYVASHTDVLRQRIASLLERGFPEARAAVSEITLCSFGSLSPASTTPGFLRGLHS